MANSTLQDRAPDWAYTLAVALVALLPRLFVAIAWAREPVWDAHYYHFGAERIAAGLGYSEHVLVEGEPTWKPWAHYPVGYSAFLAVLYTLFGSGLSVAPVANAVVGTLIVVLVHRLGWHYLSEPRARVAAGIAALHPGLIIYSAVVMTELLAALLVLLAAFLAVQWRARWRGVLLAGLALGLAVLVRPAALLAAPLLVLTQGRPWRGAVGRSAVATAVALVVTIPWTLRNCRVMDGCAFVSTNGGWNLAIGALSETGRFTTLRASDGCPVVTGQVQQDRCWARVGLQRIQRQPLRWLSLMPNKLAHTYNHESFAVEYLHEANPRAWPEQRRVAGRQLLTWFHRFVLVAAAFGVVARVGRRAPLSQRVAQWGLSTAVVAWSMFALIDVEHPFYWLVVALPLVALAWLPGRPRQGPVGRYMLGVLAITSLTHAVFFGDDRYHLIVTPGLCLLAAAALRPGAQARASWTP